MSKELCKYVVVDYFATGEGRTIFLMITRARPTYNDYEVAPSFDDNWHYTPGTEKNTADERAIREMKEFAGDWFGLGAELLSRDDFVTRYGDMVPAVALNMSEGEDQPGNIVYKSMFHFNYA